MRRRRLRHDAVNHCFLAFLSRCFGFFCASQRLRVPKKKKRAAFVASGGGTPTLNQFFGKNGLDKGRNGSATGANGILFTLDPSGFPHAVTSGSLIIMSGAWPDAPLTSNAYPANCASPCEATWTDNGSGNTWNRVFTISNCKDSNGIDHNIYYAQNVSANTNVITETHPAKVANTYWNPSNWYNVATSSALDTQSCLTGVTPANNTPPNISGTAITTTGTNELIYIEVDDTTQFGGVSKNGTPFTSITVPSGCTLLQEGSYMGHIEFYCIKATAGSFTPQFTIAQTTHDSFVIYCAAFKSGSGGSAPSAGLAVLLSAQTQTAQAGASPYTQNVACPTTTSTLVIADDAADITAVTDSNSDTFTSVGTSEKTWYNLGISISNSNTFTVSLTTSGNVDLITFYCTNATALDTSFTVGGGGTQTTSSTLFNSTTTSSGGALGTYTNLPTGTPGQTDLFIISGAAGNGPFTSCSQPTGCVMDFPSPTAVLNGACSTDPTGSNVCGGDANDYTNGDTGGHFWANNTSQINWGWTIQNNNTSASVMVTAFH